MVKSASGKLERVRVLFVCDAGIHQSPRVMRQFKAFIENNKVAYRLSLACSGFDSLDFHDKYYNADHVVPVREFTLNGVKSYAERNSFKPQIHDFVNSRQISIDDVPGWETKLVEKILGRNWRKLAKGDSK